MRASIRPLTHLHRGTVVVRSATVMGLTSLSVRRTDRPWLTLVVVPLLTVSAVLAGHFWIVVPLVALMWWWGSSSDSWLWILGVLEACWGVQWAFVGVTLFTTFPHRVPLDAALWIGYALVVAGIGAVNRWQYHRRYGL